MSQCGPPSGLPGSEERHTGTPTLARARDDARERLRSVLTALPIVLVDDASGVLTLSEGQGLQALGMKPGDFVGRSLRELYADFPAILQAVERGLRGETFSVELEFMGVVRRALPARVRAGGRGSGRVGVGAQHHRAAAHRGGAA